MALCNKERRLTEPLFFDINFIALKFFIKENVALNINEGLFDKFVVFGKTIDTNDIAQKEKQKEEAVEQVKN